MYSSTTSAFFTIIVCTSAIWSVKAATTEVPPSGGHSAASVSTENLSTDTPSLPVQKTTLNSVLNSSPNSTNSTFNNGSTTVVLPTKLSPATVPVPVKTSSEAGSSTIASTTLNSSVAIPETVNKSTTVTASTTVNSSVSIPKTVNKSTTVTASTTFLQSVSASQTSHISSTVTENNTTTTVFPNQGTSTVQGNTTGTFPVDQNSTLASGKNGNGMKYSETILTSIFSTILVVVLLTSLAFCFNKYRKQRSQYSHHPLCENVYESEGYSPPDDTLVISGGLYDAPRIYNPNMTVLEEDDSQHDYVSFSGRPGQFRLEFLPGDKDTEPAYNGSLRRNV